jgi:dUTP pyrophosphatase
MSEFDLFTKFCESIQTDSYMVVEVFVDSDDDDLKVRYKEHIQKHNETIINEPKYFNSGFDLLVPNDIHVGGQTTLKLDHLVCCSAIMHSNHETLYPCGYYMYPRSSISKTPMRLANSVGIIDSGYRGHLIAMVDVKSETSLKKYDRYFQVCAPNLCPIFVKMVDQVNTDTSRGAGGFGSTGR